MAREVINKRKELFQARSYSFLGEGDRRGLYADYLTSADQEISDHLFIGHIPGRD